MLRAFRLAALVPNRDREGADAASGGSAAAPPLADVARLVERARGSWRGVCQSGPHAARRNGLHRSNPNRDREAASRVAVGVVLVLVSGNACIPRAIPLSAPAVTAATTRPAALDTTDFALVLRRAVRPDGVDYAAVAADLAPLDRFLGRLAAVGPTRTPERFLRREDRLAYWINAFNAAILRAVAAELRPGRLPSRLWLSPELAGAFVIDGVRRVPADLRRETLREAGDDWRVRLALCGGRRGDPPLADRPFVPDLLDIQLARQAQAALAAPQIVDIDHARQRLRLGRDLFDLRYRLVADYEARTGAADAAVLNALLDLSPAARRFELNTAIGYRVELLPFDGDLNHPGEPPQRGFLSRLLPNW
jgi:hypothetical protein